MVAAGPSLTASRSLINDTGASNSDGVTTDGRTIVSGTSETGAVIELFDNGVSLGTRIVGAAGTWQFNPTLLAGDHVFTVTSTKGGLTTTSGPLSTVTVDKTAPTSSTITSFLTDAGPVGSGALTKDTTVGLTGVTSELNARVDILRNGTVIGTTTSDASGAWTFTVGSALADGKHVFTARAYDLAGNGKTSIAANLNVDSTPPGAPSITGIVGDTGASATDGLTRDNTLLIKGDGAEAGATVGVYLGGVKVGQVIAGATGAWSFNYGGVTLADGGYDFTVRQTDKAGNLGAASSAFHVTVDTATAAPTLALKAGGAAVTGAYATSTALNLSGVAEAGSTVSVSVGGSVVGTATADNTGHWSLDYAAAQGKVTFSVKATDLAGNVSTATGKTVTVDSIGPAVAFTGSTTSPTNSFFAGTAEAGSVVKVFEGATQLGQITVSASGAWSIKGARLDDSVTHTLTVQAADKAGNVTAPDGKLMIGSTGGDFLIGFSGRDILTGGKGDDFLLGGADVDVMTGGADRDTFVFGKGQSQGDTVTDFTAGADHLTFVGFGAGASLSHLGSGTWQINSTLGNETIVLTGVTTLTAADYNFL